MMEGISNEASSLAGHWGLGKLIALYDDNKISIDGSTDIAFTEDVAKRYEALGWQACPFFPLLKSFESIDIRVPHPNVFESKIYIVFVFKSKRMYR
jgi:hypothetical protein